MSSKNISALVISHKPISMTSLKRLILIFDSVYFLNPKENLYLFPDNIAKIYYPQKRMEIHHPKYLPFVNGVEFQKQEERLIDEFSNAVKSDIIGVLDPVATGFYSKFWLPLRLAYEFDTGNMRIIKLASNLVEFNQNLKIQDGIARGLWASPNGGDFYPKIPEVPKIFDSEIEKKYNCEAQMLSIVAKLNRALALSAKYNLIPVFANETLAKIYLTKAENISKSSNSPPQREFQMIKQMPLANIQYCLKRISEEIIPDEILQKIPLKELIKARNNTFHELMKLRRNFNNSIFKLSNMDFSENSLQEINCFIEHEFLPDFQKYKASFLERIKTALRITSPFISGAIGAGLSLANNLSPLETVFLTGASATVGNYCTNLTDYVSSPRKKIFRNSFGFFLNLK